MATPSKDFKPIDALLVRPPRFRAGQELSCTIVLNPDFESDHRIPIDLCAVDRDEVYSKVRLSRTTVWIDLDDVIVLPHSDQLVFRFKVRASPNGAKVFRIAASFYGLQHEFSSDLEFIK